MLPFKLIEEKVDENWKPKVDQEYLIEYKFTKDKDSIFLVGKFNTVWYGYTFHWFWGASSLQLSTVTPTDDLKSFKNIWKLIRKKDGKIKKNEFLTQNDVNI